MTMDARSPRDGGGTTRHPSADAAEQKAGMLDATRAHAGDPPLCVLRFRRPPVLPRASFWRLAMLLGVIVGGGVGLLQQVHPRAGGQHLLDWALGGVAVLLVVLAASCRGKLASWRVPPIEVFDRHLSLPKSDTSRRSERIAYPDVLSCELVESDRGRQLVIGSRRGLHVYPLASLEQPERFDELRTAIGGRIERLPDGAQRLQRLQRRESFGAAARVRPARVTWLLLVMIWLVFAVEYFSGALEQPLGLLRWGANAPLLVSGGHIELLVSAGFLHIGWVHLLVNSASLLVIGVTVERLLGPARFSLVYLASAVGGAALSALLGRSLFSVGASSAIFGLLGGLALLQVRFGLELPTGFRQPPRWWLLLLGLNGSLPLLVPQIDVAAHVGGFVAGSVCTAVLCRSAEQLRILATPKRVWLVALAALLAGTLALARVAVRGVALPDEAHAAFARALLQRSEQEPAAIPDEAANVLNVIAWRWAVAADPRPDELGLARAAAERAVELQPDRHELLDTLATVAYRQGELERAVEVERRALRLHPQRFYHSEVARFLAAHWRRFGVLRHGHGSDRANATLLPLTPSPASAPRAELQLAGTFERGAELWVLISASGRLVGSALLRVGPTDAPNLTHTLTLEGVDGRTDGLRLDVALIDLDACHDCKPGSVSWHYEAMDPAALALP